MDPATTAVWPAGGRAYEAYEDYARSYLPMSGHPPPPGTAILAWQPPQPGLDTERQHEDTVGIKNGFFSFKKDFPPGLIKLTQSQN